MDLYKQEGPVNGPDWLGNFIIYFFSQASKIRSYKHRNVFLLHSYSYFDMMDTHSQVSLRTGMFIWSCASFFVPS